MKLTRAGLEADRTAFEAAGYQLPTFDYEKICSNTLTRPVWIHFGAGNIFKAFQANVMQQLLNRGIMDVGLIAKNQGMAAPPGNDQASQLQLQSVQQPLRCVSSGNRPARV